MLSLLNVMKTTKTFAITPIEGSKVKFDSRKAKNIFAASVIPQIPPRHLEKDVSIQIKETSKIGKTAKNILNLGSWKKNPFETFKQTVHASIEKVTKKSDQDISTIEDRYAKMKNFVAEHQAKMAKQKAEHEKLFPNESRRPTIINNDLNELEQLSNDDIPAHYSKVRNDLSKSLDLENDFIGYKPPVNLNPEAPDLKINKDETKADITNKGTIASRGYEAMWRQIDTIEGLMHSFFDRMEGNNSNISLLDRLKQILSLSKGDIKWKDNPELKGLFDEAAKLGLKLPTGDTLNEEDRYRIMQNIDGCKDTFVGANESAQLRMQMYQNALKFMYECLSNFNKFFHDICETFARNVSTR
ncbi:MAG: hypothetical protein JHC93_01590 [Parachlamydiales bacterium]|nr:hypothetical protein [Parachlamydiales bacterium]